MESPEKVAELCEKYIADVNELRPGLLNEALKGENPKIAEGRSKDFPLYQLLTDLNIWVASDRSGLSLPVGDGAPTGDPKNLVHRVVAVQMIRHITGKQYGCIVGPNDSMTILPPIVRSHLLYKWRPVKTGLIINMDGAPATPFMSEGAKLIYFHVEELRDGEPKGREADTLSVMRGYGSTSWFALKVRPDREANSQLPEPLRDAAAECLVEGAMCYDSFVRLATHLQSREDLRDRYALTGTTRDGVLVYNGSDNLGQHVLKLGPVNIFLTDLRPMLQEEEVKAADA